MILSDLVKTRYTTKAFDPTRKIADEKIAQLETLLRYAPSSVNSQPWHFVVAGTQEGRARIAKAAHGMYSYNEPKIRNASHVIVFCIRKDLNDKHLAAILEQEDRDGRFPTPEAKAGQQKSRSFYVDAHKNQYRDAEIWANKQLYLAFGMLLLGAAYLEIDACSMEGIDTKVLDEELGLSEQGFASVLIVSLGYRSGDDLNAILPKSRLPAEDVITHI